MKEYRVAIAYSGGLDSSIVPILLHEKYNFLYNDMIAFYFDVGQPKQELKKAKQNCNLLGVDLECFDVRQIFVNQFIMWGIIGNSNRNGYSLGTAMCRQLIAEQICNFCKERNIPLLAHGCSGKGNDIIRFQNTINVLNPSLKILTPIADLEIDRKQEREIARQKNIIVETGFSHDVNLWNHSIGSGEYTRIGEEIPSEKFLWYKNYDQSFGLAFPFSFYHGQLVREYNHDSHFRNSISYNIEFINGKLIKIDGSENLVSKIQKMNSQLGWMGYGFHEVIEEMNSGLKSLEVYESPAADFIILSHKMFEQFVYSYNELEEKRILEKQFSDYIYQGKWFSNDCECIRNLLIKSQSRVTGSITVSFDRTKIVLVGFDSIYSLYDPKKRSLGDE